MTIFLLSKKAFSFDIPNQSSNIINIECNKKPQSIQKLIFQKNDLDEKENEIDNNDEAEQQATDAQQLQQMMEEMKQSDIKNENKQSLQIIYIFPFQNDKATNTKILTNIIDNKRYSTMNIEPLNFSMKIDLTENGFENESLYAPDFLLYFMTFWIPLLPCLVVGIIGHLLNHTFPTTNNYVKISNAIWGTRIPLLRKGLRIDIFASRMLTVRFQEYQRLIMENIIQIGKQKIARKRRMRKDMTSKRAATAKDLELADKFADMFAKRKLLGKAIDNNIIIQSFNAFNTNEKYKLKAEHIRAAKNRLTLPKRIWHTIVKNWLEYEITQLQDELEQSNTQVMFVNVVLYQNLKIQKKVYFSRF